MNKFNKIISFLLFLSLVNCSFTVTNEADAGEPILYDKIKTIKPEDVNGQYCFTKIIIKQKDDTIVKEEILECADGKRGILTPGYWELFAQFYYHDVNTPEYCRYYNRPNHAFKSYGKVCLDKNGEWEVE